MLDSITDATEATSGAIVVCGSHGGLYPAAIASRAGAHAVIFNDAGIGLGQAGIAGVRALADQGMAAAAADCMSCEIGSAQSVLSEGVISYANRVAEDCGVFPRMAVAEAVDLLRLATPPYGRLDPQREARWQQRLNGVDKPVLFVDSASLVREQDEGRIIITGSHGGLIGGNPARALKARARLAVFNDAGIGKNRIGISRLPALDRAGIAALTVSHDSARIGKAWSCVETGVISACNDVAARIGFEIGAGLAGAITALAGDLLAR